MPEQKLADLGTSDREWRQRNRRQVPASVSVLPPAGAGRPRRGVAAALAASLATFATLGVPVGVGAAVAPVDQFPDATIQYRRIELAVPPGFTATCDRKGEILICGLSEMPENFIRTLRALRGGAVAQVDIRGRRGRVFEVRLTLAKAELDFRSALLSGPARWILEVGLPPLMSDPVEDEVPFRPYPEAPGEFEPILPSSPVVAPKERGPAGDAVRACVSAGVSGRSDCLAVCDEAEKEAHARPELALQAVLARGEGAAILARTGRAPDLSSITQAISAAEAAAPSLEAKARFVLLQAKSYGPLGFPARGEGHLDGKLTEYANTAAEPWLLAGQLAAEVAAHNAENAARIVKKLQFMPGDNPNIGGAVLLAAGQTYERGDFVHALELFDNAWRRWPERLTANPQALFQYAELCTAFGRTTEAKIHYGRYLERFPRKKPHHIVRVRLADLAIEDDPQAARAKLTDLTVSLPEPEGQHLAALHVLRLANDPKERRRALRQVAAAGPSEYVRPELLVESARAALASGELRGAYEQLRDVWRAYPQDPILRRAPKLFDRVLYLLMWNYVELDRPLAAISTYYGERKRFEAHARREEIHLLAGRAFNRLGMSEEAFTVFQRGLREGGEGEGVTPELESKVYLEMATALVRLEDRFRLHEILRYLDKKYPNRFDTVAYWRAKAVDARWAGRLAEARDILVFALNGPVSDDERADLAGEVAEIYAEMGSAPKAVRALETRIALHDAAGRPHDSPVRRAASWRIAEIAYDGEDWPDALAWLGRFLDEYPGDANRNEALYMKAQALQRMGDTISAVRLYDGLITDPRGGRYGRLAEQELALLKWQRRIAPKLAREGGFAPATP